MTHAEDKETVFVSYHMFFDTSTRTRAFVAIGQRVRRPGLCLVLMLGSTTFLLAQRPDPKIFYFPKPLQPAPYVTPMKPFIRLADLKAQHKGQADWTVLVVNDKYNRAEVISAAPGTKAAMHLHADSPEYWVVQEGRMRFEIEDPPGKFQTIEAAKGALVFAPERHLHSFEVIGTEPAIRFQVTLPDVNSVFQSKPETARNGTEYIPATLSTGNNPDEVPSPDGKPDRLYFNVVDMDKEHPGKRSWADLAIRKNRAHANIICGYAADVKHRPGDRGHFHDFPEMWIIQRGQLRFAIEGVEPFIIGEGDMAYAPATRWHLPEPYGEGSACRLAMTPFPAGNHLYDPPAGGSSH
jgi:mannose-6-phosphate isomerase-like protein (cupin superfamily)